MQRRGAGLEMPVVGVEGRRGKKFATPISFSFSTDGSVGFPDFFGGAGRFAEP